MSEARSEPRARVLFFGASNVVRLLPELVRACTQALGAPLDAHASHGRGRSYLGPSNFVGRGLPAVAPPAFWRAIAGSALDDRRLPEYALLADAGNDLAYGASAAELARAIDALAARLADRGARVVVCGVPLAALEAAGPMRFKVARAVFFPTRRIERDAILREAHALDAELAGIAARRGASFVALERAWYGVDPIHVRFSRRAEAARALVAPFTAASLPSAPGRAPGLALRPAESTLFGWRRRAAQPSRRLADGTCVSWH